MAKLKHQAKIGIVKYDMKNKEELYPNKILSIR